jgi:hypothetical protein
MSIDDLSRYISIRCTLLLDTSPFEKEQQQPSAFSFFAPRETFTVTDEQLAGRPAAY